MADDLTRALAGLQEDISVALVRQRLEDGEDPLSVLQSCRDGMAIVGERHQTGKYYISDLLMAGEIFRQAMAILTPLLRSGSAPTKGKVVIGTVRTDIHDIGKDLVVSMLKAAGYEVYDLGVNVPAERFVEVLEETGAKVLGLSGLLTTSFKPMKDTIDRLADTGLRDGVRVMIGGGPVNEMVRQYTGSDAWGGDAQAAVDLCNRWMEEAGQ